MTTLAVPIGQGSRVRTVLALGAVALVTALAIRTGVTLNVALSVVVSLSIITVWFLNRPAGVIAAILFYLIKAFLVRLVYGFDLKDFGPSFDLLGMAPTLVLTGLIASTILADMSRGKSVAPDKARKFALALTALTFLSIFFPTNSLLVGFAGFQRNILPNLMIMFLTASVWQEREFRPGLVKAMLLLGVASCGYGIGQWLNGVYPWEEAWALNQFAVRGSSGLLTIGLRGIEFRIYSLFFSYMDFFFSNVAIFALAFTFRADLSRRWLFVRKLYFVLWIVILLLSVERMPLLMTFVVMIVANYLRQDKVRRKTLLKRYAILGLVLYLAIVGTAPMLRMTGAETLARLSELANPLDADSIQDRSDRIWGPVVGLIATHPWGIGTGYGSQTRASGEVSESGMWIPPHNEVLQKLLETGFAGGILYILLHIALFKTAIARRRDQEKPSNLALAFASISVAFWLCGMVNLPFSGASGLLFWSLAGIVLSQSRPMAGHPTEEQA